MKKVFLLLVVLFFTSCEIYQEPTLLTLSGEYVVDKITTHSTKNSNDLIFYSGDTYLNPTNNFPLDSIKIGFTMWHFDYSIISFLPQQNGNGRTVWKKQYYYSVINHNNIYNLGYIEFNVNGSKRIFKILDDGLESLTLRTTGPWPYNNLTTNQHITIHLTRVGP